MIAFLEEIRKQLDLIDKRTEEIRNQLDLTEQAVNKIGDDIGQLERYMKTEKPLISVKALEERKKISVSQHFMKGRDGASTYLTMLSFIILLLKPYSKAYDEGLSFLEGIHKAIGINEPIENYLANLLNGESPDLDDFKKYVLQTRGIGSFAVDSLLLFSLMETEDKGLEYLCRLFHLLDIDEKLFSEAAEAALCIKAQNFYRLMMRSAGWQFIKGVAFKGYFSAENGVDLLKQPEYLFIKNKLELAFPLFVKAADGGNSRAMYFIGEYYRFGLGGISEDNSKGFQYHRQGAELGDPLCRLNYVYECSFIHEERAKMIRPLIPELVKMAESGDVIAQDELGDAYKNIDQKEEGLKWRQRAAQKGYWRAKEHLR